MPQVVWPPPVVEAAETARSSSWLRLAPLAQRVGDGLRARFDCKDVGLRGPVRFAAILLPIPQGAERDAVAPGKLLLREGSVLIWN